MSNVVRIEHTAVWREREASRRDTSMTPADAYLAGYREARDIWRAQAVAWVAVTQVMTGCVWATVLWWAR